jgi:hypothetical protein
VRGGAWRCVEVRGGAWRCVGVRGGTWRCVEVRGGAWRYVEVRGGAWRCVEVRGGEQTDGDRDECGDGKVEQYMKVIEVGWRIRRHSKGEGKSKDQAKAKPTLRRAERPLTLQPACATTNR